MKVFVYAYEGMYQGLHGISNQDVLEVSDDILTAVKEADEWGNEESQDLIYSYGLEEEYLEDEDEDFDITESYSYCDRGWTINKIRDDITLSLSDLKHEASIHDERTFREKYCDLDDLRDVADALDNNN